jgi:uncharacterized protein YqgV (UPF0045/DUF77 family)
MLPAVVRGEFTVYPFIEGNAPPPHVQAAIDAINEAGLHVEIGPLGNTISGSVDAVLDALHRAECAALGAGATRIVIRIEVVGETGTRIVPD